MTDRLADEEIEEIRGRRDEARAGEYHDSTVYAVEDRERLLDEVERLRDRVAQLEDDALTESSEMALQMDMAEMRDEITTLTDQAQRDAGKIEMLTEEVHRAVRRKCEADNELADVKDTVRELHYNWTGVRIETLEQAVRFVVGERDIRIRDLEEEVERLRENCDRYRKALSKCLSLARDQCDPAVIGSLLAHIASTAKEALEATDE